MVRAHRPPTATLLTGTISRYCIRPYSDRRLLGSPWQPQDLFVVAGSSVEPENSLIRSGLRIVPLSLLDLFLWAFQTAGLVLKALTSGKGAFFGVLAWQ